MAVPKTGQTRVVDMLQDKRLWHTTIIPCIIPPYSSFNMGLRMILLLPSRSKAKVCQHIMCGTPEEVVHIKTFHAYQRLCVDCAYTPVFTLAVK